MMKANRAVRAAVQSHLKLAVNRLVQHRLVAQMPIVGKIFRMKALPAQLVPRIARHHAHIGQTVAHVRVLAAR